MTAAPSRDGSVQMSDCLLSSFRRWRKGNKKQVWAAAAAARRVALKTRLLLEEWRARRRHRARAWEGESTAP